MKFYFKLSIVTCAVLVLASCNKSDGSDYEKIGSSTGNFGFRSVLGETDSDDYDRIIQIKGFTIAYSDKTTRLDSSDVTINGISITDTTDSNELNYVPTKKYSFKIHTELGEATGSVTAPQFQEFNLSIYLTHVTQINR